MCGVAAIADLEPPPVPLRHRAGRRARRRSSASNPRAYSACWAGEGIACGGAGRLRGRPEAAEGGGMFGRLTAHSARLLRLGLCLTHDDAARRLPGVGLFPPLPTRRPCSRRPRSSRTPVGRPLRPGWGQAARLGTWFLECPRRRPDFTRLRRREMNAAVSFIVTVPPAARTCSTNSYVHRLCRLRPWRAEGEAGQIATGVSEYASKTEPEDGGHNNASHTT